MYNLGGTQITFAQMAHLLLTTFGPSLICFVNPLKRET